MFNFDIKAAERFVSSYPNARWEGWDILVFKPTPSGEFSTQGAYVDGRWGIQTRVTVNDKGRWLVGRV